MEEQAEQSKEPPPEPNITIQCTDAVNIQWLDTKIQAAVKFLGKEQSTITVRVVDDATMSRLHLKHSDIEGTTDVLTFDHGGDEKTINADIAVCIDVAQRAVETREHPVESELLLYILHGILHCMGYDDHNDVAHQKIHSREDSVLQAIGVGAIWSHGS